MLTCEAFVQSCLEQGTTPVPGAVGPSLTPERVTFAEHVLALLLASKGEVRHLRDSPLRVRGQSPTVRLPMALPEYVLCWDRTALVPERPTVILLELGAIRTGDAPDGTESRHRGNRGRGNLEATLLELAQVLCRGGRAGTATHSGLPAPSCSDEPLYVITASNGRHAESAELMLFAAFNPTLDCLETFYLHGAVRHWDRGVASRYLTGLFQRNLSPIVHQTAPWRCAFSRPAELECLERLCRATGHGMLKQRSVEQCVFELFREIARSFVPSDRSAMSSFDLLRLAYTDRTVERDRSLGDMARSEDAGVEMVIRDREGGLRSWHVIIAPADADIERIRGRAKAEALFRNLLVIQIRTDGITLELCNGRVHHAVRLRPDSPRREWTRFVEVLASRCLFTAVALGDTAALADVLARHAHTMCRAARMQLVAAPERSRLGRAFARFGQARPHDDVSEGAFADALAQTLILSLFAARFIQSAEDDTVSRRFTRTSAIWSGGYSHDFFHALLVALVAQDADCPSRLGLQIDESIELFDRIDLRQILTAKEGDSTRDPILHFYEQFLQSYDPKSRTQLGVFYTPRPVVSYIVRSVHAMLQREFDLDAGLADTATWRSVMACHPELQPKRLADETQAEFLALLDEPFVQILDPATGTGNFLIEIIEVIHQTHREKSRALGRTAAECQAAWNDYVPKHLLPRLFAYELTLAPYVIARLNVELKLRETGYRCASATPIHIFLTNALEPAMQSEVPVIDDPTIDDATFDNATIDEIAALQSVKRRRRFTVIVGNPPYAGHSRNNAIDWICNLVKDYTREERELRGPGQGKWLQDDYVKFLRFGQYLTTRTSVGILAMVTNHRYLTNRTFRGMRRQWCACYPMGKILDLHGNRGVQEVSPAEDDENVFDIDQGIAIGIFLRGGRSSEGYSHRDGWGPRRTASGQGKYDYLEQCDALSTDWHALQPAAPNWSFAPVSDAAEALRTEFDSCLSMLELMPGTLGPNGKPQSGIATMQDRFALGFSADEVAGNIARFLATTSREQAMAQFGTLCNPQQWDYAAAKQALASRPWQEKLTSIWFMPLDVRYTVYDGSVAVHLRRRLSDHLFRRDNLALVIGESGQEISGEDWDAVSCVNGILQLNYFRRNGSPTLPLFLYVEEEGMGSSVRRQVNLAPMALRRIADAFALPLADDGLVSGISPYDIFHYAYAVFHSPAYRSRYASFLRHEFPRLPLTRTIELFRALVAMGSKLVAAHLLQSSAPSPALGERIGAELPRIETVCWSNDCVWLDSAHASGFGGVSYPIWDYHVGGYRICQKWLKDRRQRCLTREEVGQYQRILAAVAATLDTATAIDRAIDRHGGWPRAFTMS